MVLNATDISKSFNSLRVLNNVSIAVEKGTVTGLIGPNGAGKTTFLNLVTGFLRPDSGAIRFLGQPIMNLAPHQIAAMGLARTFQTPLGFPRMTVLENLMVPFSGQIGENFLQVLLSPRVVAEQEKLYKEKALQSLEVIGLADRRHDWVEQLTAGELKMLEFARALIDNPKMLLLDEPAAGVDPDRLARLIELINWLQGHGLTCLLVDHNLRFVLEICDKIYVLAEGRVLTSGTPDEIMNDQRVVDAYLGRKGMVG